MNDTTARYPVAHQIGKALLIFHLIAWVAMALNPWFLPSGWLDILMAPLFSVLFAFFIFLLPLDPVSLIARVVAFALLIVAVRKRRSRRLWVPLLGSLLALGLAGARVALAVARM